MGIEDRLRAMREGKQAAEAERAEAERQQQERQKQDEEEQKSARAAQEQAQQEEQARSQLQNVRNRRDQLAQLLVDLEESYAEHGGAAASLQVEHEQLAAHVAKYQEILGEQGVASVKELVRSADFAEEEEVGRYHAAVQKVGEMHGRVKSAKAGLRESGVHVSENLSNNRQGDEASERDTFIASVHKTLDDLQHEETTLMEQTPEGKELLREQGAFTEEVRRRAEHFAQRQRDSYDRWSREYGASTYQGVDERPTLVNKRDAERAEVIGDQFAHETLVQEYEAGNQKFLQSRLKELGITDAMRELNEMPKLQEALRTFETDIQQTQRVYEKCLGVLVERLAESKDATSRWQFEAGQSLRGRALADAGLQRAIEQTPLADFIKFDELQKKVEWQEDMVGRMQGYGVRNRENENKWPAALPTVEQLQVHREGLQQVRAILDYAQSLTPPQLQAIFSYESRTSLAKFGTEVAEKRSAYMYQDKETYRTVERPAFAIQAKTLEAVQGAGRETRTVLERMNELLSGEAAEDGEVLRANVDKQWYAERMHVLMTKHPELKVAVQHQEQIEKHKQEVEAARGALQQAERSPMLDTAVVVEADGDHLVAQLPGATLEGKRLYDENVALRAEMSAMLQSISNKRDQDRGFFGGRGRQNDREIEGLERQIQEKHLQEEANKKALQELHRAQEQVRFLNELLNAGGVGNSISREARPIREVLADLRAQYDVVAARTLSEEEQVTYAPYAELKHKQQEAAAKYQKGMQALPKRKEAQGRELQELQSRLRPRR